VFLGLGHELEQKNTKSESYQQFIDDEKNIISYAIKNISEIRDKLFFLDQKVLP